MNQRKCGTCRYFEEGGIASSGWCRHPDRQELEHMVLVRKTELACRQGWDHDLWEPRQEGSNNGTGARVASSQPATAGSSRRPPSNRNAAVAIDPGVDAVVELNSVPRNEDSRAETQSTSAPTRNGSALVDRAREAWSSGFRVDGTSSAQGVDQLQDETVSYRPPSRNGDWQGQLERQRNRAEEPVQPVPTPSVFTRQPNAEILATVQTDKGNSAPPSVERRASEPVQQSGVTEQFEFQPAQPVEVVVDPAQEEKPDIAAPEPEDGDEDQRASSIKLPMLQTGNASCRNCRDFIPAQGGSRGWCSNPFAFETRREVSGDTVACRSSVGSWWSPSDDWWMERADIAHHSAPTPLVDNLIRQRQSRQFEEEGSTQGHERS